MRITSQLWIALGLVACGARAVSPRAGDELTVFAAASLAPVVDELARSRAEGSPRIRVNAASSSTLARQIEQGAEADVFLCAHPEWIERLLEGGFLEQDSVRDVAMNELVWVVPADSEDTSPFEIDYSVEIGLTFRGRLAMGDPTHVPLGRYAKEALEELGVWRELEPRIVPALDARAALRLVELSEVGAGIVYASDAASSDRVAIRARFPSGLSRPIRYQAAAVRGAGDAARDFLEELASPATGWVFESFGFFPAAR